MKSRRGPGLLLGLLTGMLVPPSLAVMFYATVASAPCVLLPTVASAMLGGVGRRVGAGGGQPVLRGDGL